MIPKLLKISKTKPFDEAEFPEKILEIKFNVLLSIINYNSKEMRYY